MCRDLAGVSKDGTKLYSDDINRTVQSITDRVIELVK
jgi:hypothetical protein